MTTKKPTRPWTVARYLDYAISKSEKTQAEIAREAGFKHANVITMLKLGHTKVPIDRVPALAAALEVSSSYLLELVLREYVPEIASVIEETAGMLLSGNEIAIIKYVREVSGGGDPGIGGDVAKQKLREAFGWTHPDVPLHRRSPGRAGD
jgi:hypothetical protein